MKKLVWLVGGIAVLLLAFWLLQILVIYPEQAEVAKRELRARGEEILRRSLAPDAVKREAIESGLLARINTDHQGFDQGYDGCDTEVTVWPKHNSDAPFRYRLFLRIKYVGVTPKYYRVLLYGNL
jgi:hypothetical protein